MKNGFGLLEVLISAVVLGFLLIGLNKLQMGNREAVLRIRTRDAAQIIAQNFIDSLNGLGISSIPDINKKDTVYYEWKGNNEKIIDKKLYTRDYAISAVEDLKSTESSDYARSTQGTADKVDTVHISAKRVDLTVSWLFKNSPMKIREERIIK